MSNKTFNNELDRFIRSEMLDNLVFEDNHGRKSQVSYTDFFAKLCQRERLVSHLELVSCITPLDEFYPIVYDCFREDYGQIDFKTYPKSLQKFSPSLFTLCLDFVNNEGVIITREYTKQGKNLAYIEKLLCSEIHYTLLYSNEEKSVYYKDFLMEIMQNSGTPEHSLDDLILEAQEIMLSNSQKIEFSETIMMMFSVIFHGVISPPSKITKLLRATYAEDLKFMFSAVGIYTCMNHINKIGDLKVLLPAMYTVSKAESPKNNKRTIILIAIVVLAIIIGGLIRMYR